MNNLEILDRLVHEYEDKYPSIKTKAGSRAQSARKLVEAGNYSFLGLLPKGGSSWLVNGHFVNLEWGHCDCKDIAPFGDDGRRLCKHVIALEFVIVLKQETLARLVRIIHEAEADMEDTVTLFPRVYFTYDGDNPQDNMLDRYRLGNRPVVELGTPVAITSLDLHNALLETGWCVGNRVGGGDIGQREHWMLNPQPEEMVGASDWERTRIGVLDGASDNVVAQGTWEFQVRSHASGYVKPLEPRGPGVFFGGAVDREEDEELESILAGLPAHVREEMLEYAY